MRIIRLNKRLLRHTQKFKVPRIPSAQPRHGLHLPQYHPFVRAGISHHDGIRKVDIGRDLRIATDGTTPALDGAVFVLLVGGELAAGFGGFGGSLVGSVGAVEAGATGVIFLVPVDNVIDEVEYAAVGKDVDDADAGCGEDSKLRMGDAGELDLPLHVHYDGSEFD